MKTKIFLLSLLCVINTKAELSFKDYKAHFVEYEGLKTNVYQCSTGHYTVGIGHSFEKGEKVKNSYSNIEIDKFFEKDLKEAKQIALKTFSSFNNQPEEVQMILISLSFNLGEAGINKFVKFKRAIDKKQYKVASKELKNSLWYNQTGKRGISYVNLLNNITNK